MSVLHLFYFKGHIRRLSDVGLPNCLRSDAIMIRINACSDHLLDLRRVHKMARKSHWLGSNYASTVSGYLESPSQPTEVPEKSWEKKKYEIFIN